MTQPNDSILVTPGSGATVATHPVSAKEFEAIMAAWANGHILGTEAMYFFNTGSFQISTGGTAIFDIFNADPALVVRLLLLEQITNIETAVAGAGQEWELMTQTTVGSGGTALTAWLADTTDTALDADITARVLPTTVTGVTSLKWFYTHSEEATGSHQMQGGWMPGRTGVLPSPLARPGLLWGEPPAPAKGFVMRQNRGLIIAHRTASTAGNSAILAGFTVE